MRTVSFFAPINIILPTLKIICNAIRSFSEVLGAEFDHDVSEKTASLSLNKYAFKISYNLLTAK